MVNREMAIVVTIAAIMISLFGVIFQTQGASETLPPDFKLPVATKNTASPLPSHKSPPTANPAGSNMTGAAGNTTGGAHDSSVHTTNPAAYSTHDSGRSIRNVK
ncbi:hypothetical protein [Nitrososphaera sp. AFS]|uniref:hypothetical protein n=1 Tax=Nitrososphaera sp. AFS TaxID=2301191 RepID=UPI0013924724|nr:hypothetical protein [Nitrososphaera sp. AFS]NAL78605.1 hypothetical protein [Nitrososphaera sp. AFS]